MNKQKAKLAKRLLTIGLFVMIAVAIACFALAMYFFDNPRIAPHSLYNAGVDVLGTLICAVLFFGCMSQLENATFHFVSLIVLTSLSFFNNEWYWYLSGLPRYRTVYLILSVQTELMDLGLTYFFFRYVSGALSSCYQFITGRIYYGYDRNELCSPLFKGYSLEL